MNTIEQITSEQVKNLLPDDTVNLLWYLWETECRRKEVRMNLTILPDNKQNIIVYAGKKELQSHTVTLDNPVNADVLIQIPRNRFVMKMKQ